MDTDKTTKELITQLQEIANTENALVMSFIASEAGVRVSPVSYYNTSITIQDLYEIEKHVNKLEEEDRLPDKLHLVIHTTGGYVYAATKISKYLQAKFKEIIAYVPYEAASGGTMICLVASRIVMDEASNLTQIDPQIYYQGQRIAAGVYDQAIKDFADLNHNKRPEEMDPPYQQMADKFDPIIRTEMAKAVRDNLSVAFELHKRATKAKTDDEVRRVFEAVYYLNNTTSPHEHIIDKAEATEIGLPISSTPDEKKRLKTYKSWVSSKLKSQEANHIINIYCPKVAPKGEKDVSAEPVSIERQPKASSRTKE